MATDTPKPTPQPKHQNQLQLLDLLDDISNALDVASFIGQDVWEDYFEAYNPADEKDHCSIIYDFTRHSIKMWVVINAIEEAKQALNDFNAPNDIHRGGKPNERTRSFGENP